MVLGERVQIWAGILDGEPGGGGRSYTVCVGGWVACAAYLGCMRWVGEDGHCVG